jgi:hypothetical protein
MKVMNLIGRDSLSLKKRKSNVGEGAMLGCPASPILALHHAIIGRGTAKRDAISFVIRAHPGESAAAGDPPFEVANV